MSSLGDPVDETVWVSLETSTDDRSPALSEKNRRSLTPWDAKKELVG